MWPLVKPKARHFLAMLVFVPVLLIAQYFLVIQSNEYQEAENFVSSDQRLSGVIGAVKKFDFKFWADFKSVAGIGGSASYSFNVTTERGMFVATVELRNSSEGWHVVKAYGQDPNGATFRVDI